MCNDSTNANTGLDESTGCGSFKQEQAIEAIAAKQAKVQEARECAMAYLQGQYAYEDYRTARQWTGPDFYTAVAILVDATAPTPAQT